MSPLSVPTRRPVARRLVALAAAAAAALVSLAPAAMADTPGFLTKARPMLVGVAGGVTVKPLLTVGDVLPNGFRFEAIPDGIALDPRGTERLDIYVNHETSKVPFPATLTDFDNAQVSKLTLKRGTGKILDGSFVIDSSANYQRFCSNFMAGPEQGFDRYIVFTNEEALDTVNRTGLSWPLDGGGSNPEQPGVVVAYDVDTGEYRSIYGMGRHNHENSVAIPGYEDLVILSGDDTFTSFPPASQFYMYVADDTDAVWNDEGMLYAFKADPAVNASPPTIGSPPVANPLYGDDYYDVTAGEVVTGSFVEVPEAIAVGDQAALESWSDANGVFQFHRIEDVAYDRNSPNVLYLADSGRASTSIPTGETFASKNGRIWRMELDPSDPTEVVSLTILVEGEAFAMKDPATIHQPDNLETTTRSLLIQEDPSSGNQYLPSEPGATTARIWRYDLATGALSVVARVDQSADEGPTDVDADPLAAKWGNWESSGIVDASAYFGPGAFLVDVQTHSLFVDTAPLGYGGVTQKREGGQLLLVRIPGA